MVKVILFDFWGTLVENGVRSPIKQVKEILKIDIPFSEYVTRMQSVMMTKKHKSLQEAFKLICKEFSKECDEDIIDHLVGMWNKSWMLAEPYSETISELKNLANDYKLVLVSNTDNFSIENVLEKFDLRSLFSEIFFSYELGLLKTEKMFFESVLRKLNVEPRDCVMVGDSIQSDVMPAKRIDIKAILMDRRDRRDFPLKVKNLSELKEVIS